MAFIEWTHELSIGVDEIDRQHKKLINIINEFHTAVNQKKKEDAIRLAVGNLISYIGTHFTAEEKLMEENNYPQIHLHKNIHNYLTEEVLRYAKQLGEGQKILDLDMAIFLKGWLENHIAETDKKIGYFLANKKQTFNSNS